MHACAMNLHWCTAGTRGYAHLYCAWWCAAEPVLQAQIKVSDGSGRLKFTVKAGEYKFAFELLVPDSYPADGPDVNVLSTNFHCAYAAPPPGYVRRRGGAHAAGNAMTPLAPCITLACRFCRQHGHRAS